MYNLLKGVRVLDLSTVVLGPFVTQLLGDLGADVIKVEAPEGDVFRSVAPSRNPSMGPGYLNLNRNKRSIVLDLKKDSGRGAFDRLVKTSDVFFHNMRPSAIERLRLGYGDLKKINPALIYCAAVGFSKKGPYTGSPAYDDIIQGMSGLAHMSRTPEGEPRFVATLLADKVCAFYSLYAILAALFHRTRTGRGMEIEAPMFESLVSFLMVEHLHGRTFDPPLGDTGYNRVTNPYRRPYRTADGFLAVLPYTTRHWQRFFSHLGMEEFADREWVRDPNKRSSRIDELYGKLAEEIAKQPTDYWVRELKKLDIPFSLINSLEDLFEDPHLEAISFFRKVEHPTEGKLVATEHPVSFEGADREGDRPAPALGQNGLEILREAGLTTAEIRTLESDGGILLPAPPENDPSKVPARTG